MEPLVSIIVPMYNAERYILNCLASINQQTLKGFEVIIIDDGSTDSSASLAEEYIQNRPDFRIIHTTNSGPSHARNIGLDLAVGKYIMFVDADDSIDSNSIADLIQIAEQGSYDLVVYNYICKEFNSLRITEAEPLFEDMMVFEGASLNRFNHFMVSNGLLNNIWAKLFRKDLIGGTRFNENSRIFEDVEFCARLIPKLKKVIYANRSYYKFCKTPDSLTSNYTPHYSQIIALHRIINDALYQCGLKDFEQDVDDCICLGLINHSNSIFTAGNMRNASGAVRFNALMDAYSAPKFVEYIKKGTARGLGFVNRLRRILVSHRLMRVDFLFCLIVNFFQKK